MLSTPEARLDGPEAAALGMAFPDAESRSRLVADLRRLAAMIEGHLTPLNNADPELVLWIPLEARHSASVIRHLDFVAQEARAAGGACFVRSADGARRDL